MKVLITGGGGFIGSHLVDSQLAQGHRVRTVDLNAERLSHTSGHPNLEKAYSTHFVRKEGPLKQKSAVADGDVT